ncbi:MAG: transcriptional regulator [Pseudomonas fluorescens]|nr:transcriptional regulator [Pseudomonas fluorescens]
MSYRHRDDFDAGSLHYEHLPVLGRAIARLKRRLG